MTPMRIPFLSLKPHEDAVAVNEAIRRVVDRGWFVLGPEVEKLEGPVVATLKKSPLWADLGVSKRYGPRGSRMVDVKTCP